MWTQHWSVAQMCAHGVQLIKILFFIPPWSTSFNPPYKQAARFGWWSIKGPWVDLGNTFEAFDVPMFNTSTSCLIVTNRPLQLMTITGRLRLKEEKDINNSNWKQVWGQGGLRCPQLAGHSPSRWPLRVNQNTDKPRSFVPLHTFVNATHAWDEMTRTLLSLSHILREAASWN